MRQPKNMSGKAQSKSTSTVQLMQLLKFEVVKLESAQDDKWMQQAQDEFDLKEPLDELRQQKACV